MISAPGRIRVLIADDHPMIREGLRRLLPNEEFEIVAEAADGRQAAELSTAHRPDVVLMDVAMREMDGLAGLQMIKREQPDMPVIMLSTYETASYVVRAIASGAAGYLLKGVSQEELVQAIRAVAGGRSIIDRDLVRSVVGNLLQQPGGVELEGTGERLTPREMEVLALVAQGLTNREVGNLLGIAEGTVRAHVQSIVQKLGVADRTEAAVWAVQRRLLR